MLILEKILYQTNNINLWKAFATVCECNGSL